MLDREVKTHCWTYPGTWVGAYWWTARISAWLSCRLLAPRRRLTLLGALKVTPGSCDSADDVRLGRAFLGPDHEFSGIPFIAL